MPYRMTRARREHAKSVRASLVAAATAIIRERGVEAITVREVVKRADSSVGNYYHHFSSKASLLLAIADEVTAAAFARADRAADRAEFSAPEPGDEAGVIAAARLAALVISGIRAALEEPELARVLFVGEPELRSRILVRTSQRTADRLAPLVGSEPAERYAALWQGAVFMLIERALGGSVAFDPVEAGALCARWNLRAIGTDEATVDRALVLAQVAAG